MHFATPYMAAACGGVFIIAAVRAARKPKGDRESAVGTAIVWLLWALCFLSAYRFPVQY